MRRGSDQWDQSKVIVSNPLLHTPFLAPLSLLWAYQLVEAFYRVFRAYVEQFLAVLQYQRLSFVHSASTMVQYHWSSNRAYTSSSLLSQICFKVSWLASCQKILSSGNMVTNTLCPSGNAMRSNVSTFTIFHNAQSSAEHEELLKSENV